jgi:hypothetical protein
MDWMLGLLAALAVGLAARLAVRHGRRRRSIKAVDVLLDDIEHGGPPPAPFQHPELEQTMPAVLALRPERRARPPGRERGHEGELPSDFD